MHNIMLKWKTSKMTTRNFFNSMIFYIESTCNKFEIWNYERIIYLKNQIYGIVYLYRSTV